MPDFLVIGAARSATTSLHYYLEQHPMVTMSRIKEPNHFAFDHTVEPPRPLIDPASAIITKSVVDRDAYERLFARSGPGGRVGEASPLYLYVQEAPGQIRTALGTPDLIAVLRNPVDRAYSHFLHIRRDSPGTVLEEFERACDAEMERGTGYTPYASGTHVLRMGLYDQQLERYLETFGPEPLLVLGYDAVVGTPAVALAEVCDHLGLAPHEFDTGVQYNRSGVARSEGRARVGRMARSVQPLVKAALPAGVAARLGRIRAARVRPDAAPALPGPLRERLVEWFHPSVERVRALGYAHATAWDEFT